MSTYFAVEVRRALSRRLVRTLVVVALVGIAVAGILAYRNAAVGPDRFRLTDLWPDARSDALLLPAAVLLLLTALVAGASMVGADLRSGTLALVLTWEPRRVRVLAARAASCFAVALVVAVALQVLLVAALLPAALLEGTTAGAGQAWWEDLAGAVLRIAAATGLAAVIGMSLALLFRNTTAAVAAVVLLLNVVEPLARAVRPTWSRWLLAENTATWVTGGPLEDAASSPSALGAAVVLSTATAGALVLAMLAFQRRDAV